MELMFHLLCIVLLMLSMMFISLKHPAMLSILILFMSTLVCFLTGYVSKSFWFSYILFLIFVGGMLVLLIYMTALASNEKFKFSSKTLINLMSLALMLMMSLILTDSFLSLPLTNSLENLSLMSYENLMEENTTSLNKFYNYPMNMTLLLMIMYLFLTLIACVKITNNIKGPLRMKI